MSPENLLAYPSPDAPPPSPESERLVGAYRDRLMPLLARFPYVEQAAAEDGSESDQVGQKGSLDADESRKEVGDFLLRNRDLLKREFREGTKKNWLSETVLEHARRGRFADAMDATVNAFTRYPDDKWVLQEFVDFCLEVPTRYLVPHVSKALHAAEAAVMNCPSHPQAFADLALIKRAGNLDISSELAFVTKEAARLLDERPLLSDAIHDLAVFFGKIGDFEKMGVCAQAPIKDANRDRDFDRLAIAQALVSCAIEGLGDLAAAVDCMDQLCLTEGLPEGVEPLVFVPEALKRSAVMIARHCRDHAAAVALLERSAEGWSPAPPFDLVIATQAAREALGAETKNG